MLKKKKFIKNNELNKIFTNMLNWKYVNCKNKKKSISLLRTANKDIACLRSTVSSLDAKVTFEVRETDFTERCRFKLSVLATDAFALMWMDWTIEAIIIRIYFCVLL